MIAKPPRPLRRRGEGVPLIAATEPESHPCHPQEIPDQVRDEVGQAWDEGNRGRQNNPATPQGFTILPNTMGVHTPAYALSPLQGYIIFHFPLPSAIIDFPLIPATEPESLPCFSGEIPDQVRDEGIKPAMRGIGAAKTILPPRWGSLFYRIQRGLTPPAYVLSPLQGYIIFHFPFSILHFSFSIAFGDYRHD